MLTLMKESIYTDVVRPILDNKCIKCHNQNKSNGKLRLTDQEQMLLVENLTHFIPSNSNESLYSYLELLLIINYICHPKEINN